MDHITQQKKQKHPMEKANLFSFLSFYYILDLFIKGSKRDLRENDLYEVLPSYESKKLGDQMQKEWNKYKNDRPQILILRLVLKCYRLNILFLGISQLIYETVTILLQPYAFSKIIYYFSDQKDMTRAQLYVFGCLLITVNFLGVFYIHNYHFAVKGLGIKIRAAFSSLIYRKALRLNATQSKQISVGKIVTLISTDVGYLEYFSFLVTDLWIALVKTIIVCWVIYLKIKSAALTGIGFFLLMLPLQIYLGTWAAKLRTKMCQKIDERLHLTQETLSAIKIIKMYTWEKFFIKRTMNSRKKEIRSMHAIFYIKLIIFQIGSLSGNVAFYLFIMSYKWLGNDITAETVYYIDSCFHILATSLGAEFPSAVTLIAEVVASITRVVEFLKLPEATTNNDSHFASEPKITFENVTVNLYEKKVLQSVNLTISRGVNAMTGPIGCGKSVLLKTILKEFIPVTGNIFVEGNVSYGSQEPWLFPSSIKQNILFGEKYEKDRYEKVLQVCALKYDLSLLPAQDLTIVEDRGVNLSKGQQVRINLARAVYKVSQIYLLDDCLSSLDNHVSDFIFTECIQKFLANNVVVFVTHNIQYIKQAKHTIVINNRGVTEMKPSSQTQYFKNDKKSENYKNYNLSQMTDNQGRKVYEESKKSGGVDANAYKQYLNFGGGKFALLVILVLFGAAQFVISYSDKLLSQWVNIEQDLSNYTSLNLTEDIKDNVERRNNLLKTYTAMIILSTVVGLISSFAFYSVIRKASVNLYKHAIISIVNATMKFFDSTFVGNVLNRFSKDFTVIDDHLPFMFNHVMRVIFSITGMVILIATVNTFFLLPSLLFFGMLVLVRSFYLKTSRSLKRLDAITRSPVVGYFNASIEGLSVIRAYQAEKILSLEFDRHHDLYTSAAFVFQNAMKSFAFTLDFLCHVFVTIIIVRFLVSNEDFPAGSVGLAISQALKMTGNLQWGVRMWSEMENSMTSVERVLEYTEIEQEKADGQMLDHFPRQGTITFDNVSLCYPNSDTCTLKEVSFNVSSGKKVGIIGRTGAGKSSILSVLFRLYPIRGTILIDGVDIKSMSVQFLRKHISVIPQDPVIFTGTLRDNIDPERSYTDDEIWKALHAVNLDNCVYSLDTQIANDSNFSLGQRQLICVARALIRNNKIVVLDEATANMDNETDVLIHQTISKVFATCTVIIIAHKLHSIIGLDKVVVMENSKVIDFDSPGNLLARKNNYFYKMVKRSELLPETLSSSSDI